MKLPVDKSLVKLGRILRNNGTKSEAFLWKYLKQKNVNGYQFHRQKTIGKYIVDFYCPKLALVIEVDGNSHDEKYEYDSERDKYLRDLGLFILHLDNEDLLFHKNKAFYAIETCVLHRIQEINEFNE